MKVLILIAALSMFGGPGEPATKSATCHIHGKVSDSSNAEALAGAAVEVVELNRTVYASFDGTFMLSDLPPGVYTLSVLSPGYRRMLVEHVDLSEGRRSLAIELEQR